MFRPAPWLPGPHLPTMWGKFFRSPPEIETRVEVVPTGDGDSIDLVRVTRDEGRPRLLLLHGLEGTMRSHYVPGIFQEALRAGLEPVILLFRTCNGRLNQARRTYHSGETSDLQLVVERLTNTSNAPLAIGGVSLGGNVLLKWLGERASELPPQLVGAIAVSVPFDLERSSRRISQGFSRLYEVNFLRHLRRKALAKIGQYPDLVDPDAVSRARTLWEFDDRFTAPVHGFADASDYYRRSSSIRFLDQIRLRTLLLSARDDPFHPPEVLDDVAAIARSNAHLICEFTDAGGHAGFVGGSHPWRPRYYMEERMIAFAAESVRRSQAHILAAR